YSYFFLSIYTHNRHLHYFPTRRSSDLEFDELKKKIEAAGMSKDVRDKAMQELKKLEAMPPMSAESTVSRNYLDWLLETVDSADIDRKSTRLNSSHVKTSYAVFCLKKKT